jgi:hypothetical protein
MFHFGSGTIWGRATSDALGNTIANGTPRLFGTLQDVSIDISYDNKELYGRNSFPEQVARGKGKITGKASYAKIYGAMLNELFFGQTNTTGSSPVAIAEAGQVPATTTYIVTVANSATFFEDLGVVYAATGLSLKLVASGPTVGQYSVSAGVYTFAAADASANVQISYVYTSTIVGNTTKVLNTLMGTTPTFEFISTFQKDGKQLNLKLYQCISTKLTMATKIDDYMIPSFDFSAFANNAGNVIDIYASE